MRRLPVVLLLALVLFLAVDFVLDRAMMHGVNNYYGLNQHSKVLLIGHSHLMLSTDKKRMEDELGVKVSKYCREGVNVNDRETMINHFLNNGYADSLVTVLYGVDLYTFTGEGLSKNSYQLFYPFIDNPDVDKYIKKQAKPIDYWLHKFVRSTRYNNDGLKNSVLRGWTDNWDNFKTNIIDDKSYRDQTAKSGIQSIEMNDTLINVFKRTVKTLTDRGINVVLVNTPTIDILNRSQGKKYNRIVDWFRNFAASDSLIDYWDFNPAFSSNHTIFSDPIHLNVRGQQLITTEIIDLLNNTYVVTIP